MCKKKFQSTCVCRNKLSKPRCRTVAGRASFTDYSKATRVREFYTAYTGVVETNFPALESTGVFISGIVNPIFQKKCKVFILGECSLQDLRVE